jgi:hypothetical protein
MSRVIHDENRPERPQPVALKLKHNRVRSERVRNPGRTSVGRSAPVGPEEHCVNGVSPAVLASDQVRKVLGPPCEQGPVARPQLVHHVVKRQAGRKSHGSSPELGHKPVRARPNSSTPACHAIDGPKHRPTQLARLVTKATVGSRARESLRCCRKLQQLDPDERRTKVTPPFVEARYSHAIDGVQPLDVEYRTVGRWIDRNNLQRF